MPRAPRPVTPVGIAAAIVGGLDGYVEDCTSPPSPALAALARRTAAVDWDARGDGVALEQEMLSGHLEGQLLKMLVRATRARSVLEIGMFTGYSALAMAEGLPADGRLVACELDGQAAAIAQEAFDASPAGERIDVRVGPALRTLSELALDGEAFDFVFVDADKAGYAEYLDALLDTGLLAPGGLIAVDNTLMQGEPWATSAPSPNGAAIRAFNARVAADPRVEQVLLPVRDGVTLIQRVAA